MQTEVKSHRKLIFELLYFIEYSSHISLQNNQLFASMFGEYLCVCFGNCLVDSEVNHSDNKNKFFEIIDKFMAKVLIKNHLFSTQLIQLILIPRNNLQIFSQLVNNIAWLQLD